MKELFWILGIAYVLSCLPALVMFLRARRRFSGTRIVTCPETRRAAMIRLDSVHAAATNLTGEPDLRIDSCNRWGGPVGHCEQGCVGEIEERRPEHAESA